MGPLVSDDVPPGELVLAAGADIPAASGAVAAQIAAHDGVDGLVPLRTAFSYGAPVHFWDFGPTAPASAPIWIIVKDAEEGPFTYGDRTFAPVGHPNVVDAVPGDPAYSPIWSFTLVPVTEAWDGEVFPSAAAVDAGVAAGLLEPPIPLSRAINCPIVAPETRLDLGPGQDPEPPHAGYFRGTVVTYFTFDVFSLDAVGAAASAPVYELRREGGERLDEAVRGVDITGDGDRVDSNNVFSAIQGDAGYTGLVTAVDVVMDVGYASIDTSEDDATADLTDASQLFTSRGDPDPDWVVAFYPSDDVYNRPIQLEEER